MTDVDHHPKGFHIAHYNVRSLIPKLDSIKLWLDSNPFKVITLNETWLTPDIPNSMLDFEDYYIHRQDRASGKKGGGPHPNKKIYRAQIK